MVSSSNSAQVGLVYAVEFQCRALAPVFAAPDDKIQFYIGTQGLTNPNEIHRIEYIEDYNTTSSEDFDESLSMNSLSLSSSIVGVSNSSSVVKRKIWKFPSTSTKNESLGGKHEEIWQIEPSPTDCNQLITRHGRIVQGEQPCYEMGATLWSLGQQGSVLETPEDGQKPLSSGFITVPLKSSNAAGTGNFSSKNMLIPLVQLQTDGKGQTSSNALHAIRHVSWHPHMSPEGEDSNHALTPRNKKSGNPEDSDDFDSIGDEDRLFTHTENRVMVITADTLWLNDLNRTVSKSTTAADQSITTNGDNTCKATVISAGKACSKLFEESSLMSDPTSGFTTGDWNPHQNGNQFAALHNSNVTGWDIRSLYSGPVWSLYDEKNVGNLSGSYMTSTHNHHFRSLDFNRNKQYHLVTGSDDGSLAFWDVRGAGRKGPTSSGLPYSSCLLDTTRDLHDHWIWSVKFNSFHDQLLLSSSSDGRVELSSKASLSSEPYGTVINDDGVDSSSLQSSCSDLSCSNSSDGGGDLSLHRRRDESLATSVPAKKSPALLQKEEEEQDWSLLRRQRAFGCVVSTGKNSDFLSGDSDFVNIEEDDLSRKVRRQNLRNKMADRQLIIPDGRISLLADSADESSVGSSSQQWHEDSVYSAVWAANDPWTFASLSYDGRLVVSQVPKAIKYKILNLL